MSEPSREAKTAASNWWIDGNSNVANHQAYALGYDAGKGEQVSEIEKPEYRTMKELTPEQALDAIKKIRGWLKAGATIKARDVTKPILEGIEGQDENYSGWLHIQLPSTEE